MQLEKVQYTAQAHTLGAFGLLSRFLVVLFAATVSLAATVNVLAPQPAQMGALAQGATRARAAQTMTEKEIAITQLNTVTQLDTVPSTATDAIRPFRIKIPEEALVDLRRRIAATKWPERESVSDATQGVQLATMQKLAHYWATDYDWRKVEARLNALPQFITEIDGLDIHFIHVRSKHEKALPMIVTQGWPV